MPSALCRMDLLLLRDAGFPGLDILLGGSAGGARLAEESWHGAVSLGTGVAEARRVQEQGTEVSKDKELHPGDGQGRGDPGKGSELQLHRRGSVGGGFSTNSKSIKSKREEHEFRGTERIHGLGSNSASIFSQKREGSKPPFLKKGFLFCSSPDEKLSAPSPVRRS